MRRVALVTIARDEAPRIGRLLSSVRPWVDEMWVLDTGSVDDTIAVARDHGARVESRPWPDDFAAARNQALELAAADWHLVLDADEWLVDGGPLIAALRRQAPAFAGALHFDDRFDDGDGRAGHATHWITRVLPGAVRYAGRVHEQPQHRLPTRRLAVTVGHDGYAADRLQAKAGRNRRLLQAALAESPGDAYLHYQLGKDLDVYGEHPEAVAAFERAAALARGDEPWACDRVVRQLFGLKRLARHAEAVQLAGGLTGRFPDSPDFFFAVGDLMLDLAAHDPARAGEALPLAEAAWRRCLDIGERGDQPHAVAGRGGRDAAHNLALLLDFSGRGDEADGLRARWALERPSP